MNPNSSPRAPGGRPMVDAEWGMDVSVAESEKSGSISLKRVAKEVASRYLHDTSLRFSSFLVMYPLSTSVFHMLGLERRPRSRTRH